MVAFTPFIAAFSIFALSFAAPMHSVATRAVAGYGTYIMFGGDGTVQKGWPAKKLWLSFDDAWQANLKIIQNSCQVEGWGENNSDSEMQAIKNSIVSESSASGMPKEFILAIVMQESKGCVRAPTTYWSHANPGLMQSAQGKGTCNPSGKPISPCPDATIRQMIHDGTDGDGLETTLTQCVADSGATDDSKWYRAARVYNAGRITDNNLGIGPTPCYASDIANRLVSPFNWSPCDNAVIGSLTGAQGTVPAEPESSPTSAAPPASSTTAKPAPTPTPVPGEFNEIPNTGSPKPDLIINGAAAGCTRYYTPLSGDTCASAPVDLATLRRLNDGLNPECTNLWAGYAYCIAT